MERIFPKFHELFGLARIFREVFRKAVQNVFRVAKTGLAGKVFKPFQESLL